MSYAQFEALPPSSSAHEAILIDTGHEVMVLYFIEGDISFLSCHNGIVVSLKRCCVCQCSTF